MPVTRQFDQDRSALARYLQSRLQQPASSTQIERVPAGATAPLSPEQRQVWLHAQLAPELPLYNEPFTILREGPLDVAILQRALTELIRRHEAWRTTFHLENGELVQHVHPAFEVRVPFFDVSAEAEERRMPRALQFAAEDARTAFDLSRLPLFRCRLIKTAEQQYRLFVTAHHLIFDGVTGYQVFLPELATIYEAISRGDPFSLPELPFQYADYAARKCADARAENADLAYWLEQLKGAPAYLNFPTDRPRPPAPTFHGAMQSFSLSHGLRAALARLSSQHNTTLFATLLAALNVLLYRYSGQEDITVGSVTAGRTMPGSEKLMGFFLNTIAIRSKLSTGQTFSELLATVRNTCLYALAHDQTPLDRVVQALHPHREIAANPLFQVLLSMEPSLASKIAGWDFSALDVETRTAKYDLTMVIDDRLDGLSGRLIYNTDLFEPDTISRMLRCWTTLLENIVAAPETPLGRLNIVPAAERDALLHGWNTQSTQAAPEPVHQIFERVANTKAASTAVSCGSAQLTYGELEDRASRLAEHLLSLGVKSNDAIALCVERSPEMVIGILAVLKAGAAYVPLDPTYPRERLSFMLEDSGAKLLLTQSHLPALPYADRVTAVHLDRVEPANASKPERVLQSCPAMDDLAYIIYTSGSTGRPKGVEVTYRNLAGSTRARLEYYRTAPSKYLLLSSFSFDSSVAVIFHALCTGATLVVPSPEASLTPRQVLNTIRQQQITDVLCVPSLYSEVLESAEPDQLRSLKRVIVAGEACPSHLVEAHFRQLPSAELFNEYGPTEATVWASIYRCELSNRQHAVPLGRPISGTQIYILDRNLELLPMGVPGELCIAGQGVAKGYHNAPDLTSERFVLNPFTSQRSAKMYRTGDRARCLPDGNIEFLGRIDQQVKLRGLRIELEEIEATLMSHPDVREAAVLMQGEASGKPHLAAYVVPGLRDDTSEAELRAFLQCRLPSYMVPSFFDLRRALPRTANGKIDRDALRLRQASESPKKNAPARPRDFLESRLLAIWQEVLGPNAVNVDQDFFALGGHSLLAARLLDRIERETGQTLSLAFIFQAPTVRLMAESLQTPERSLRSRAIVPIQPNGNRIPLFWIRGGARFRLLAQKLGPDQPFFGLDLPYSDARKLPVPFRLEDVAAFLVRALKEQQPQGPYALAGLCVNAVIAYEVARQLKSAGDEVGLVALLDGHNRAYYKSPLRDGRYTARVKYHVSNILRLGVRERSAYMLARLDEAFRIIERAKWQFSADDSGTDSAQRHNTDPFVHPAFHRYEPGAYAGSIVLLQSSQWPDAPYFDFRLGWEDLVEGIEFHRIPGSHPGMFTEPNVNLVAAQLRAYLDKLPAL